MQFEGGVQMQCMTTICTQTMSSQLPHCQEESMTRGVVTIDGSHMVRKEDWDPAAQHDRGKPLRDLLASI